ncbi:TonB-dependent receptor [Saccharicrinis fermentans]|uniref:TonB-dependent receptor n=1 Tax=Saccharicrinis fermentans TaxID=982 RepID=UPI000481F50D|nr:TonB-dependent receptor [Saccharicrinis fermentans]
MTTYAQNIILEGNVSCSGTQEVLPFANVYIDSLYNTATITKKDGSYKLHPSSTGTYNLCVSHIGYEKFCTTVHVNKGINHIDITLSPSSYKMNPIVVTGTGTQHRVDDVPVQTEIITQKDIQEIAGRNMEDIISGISSSVDFTSSSMGTNIKINGLGADYVLILLNGKRLTGGVGGYTDLSRISTDDIEQIEIVKGASSTLYGSDAIAGVINIITKKEKKKTTISNNTRMGEYGDFKQFNAFSYNKGALSSKTTFSYQQIDGWQLNNMKYNPSWESNHNLPFLVRTYDKPVNKSRGYTITQNFDYHFSKKLQIHTHASWYEKTLYFPFKGRMHNYYYNNQNAALGVYYKLKNKNYMELNIDYGNYLYYNEYPYKYNETYITNDDLIKVTYYPGDRFRNSAQRIINAQFKTVVHMNSKNKLSMGAELMSDKLEAKYRLTKPTVSAHTASIYCQDEIKLTKKTVLVAGLRLLSHNITGTSATPKVSAMYKQSKITHRVNYAYGFKSPTLKELYYYYKSERMGALRLYLGNEELKPQRSHYLSYAPEIKLKTITTGFNVYHNRIYDKIDFEIIPTEYEHARQGIEETKMRYNIDNARTLGIDYYFSYRISHPISLQGGYSYVDAKNMTENIPLNGVSKHSATLKVSWNKKCLKNKLNLLISGVYKSEKFYLEEDLTKSYAKPYQLWKLTANYEYKQFKNMDITLTSGIDNIFNYVDDSPYGSHYGTLNPGRTLYAGIKIQFAKEKQTN